MARSKARLDQAQSGGGGRVTRGPRAERRLSMQARRRSRAQAARQRVLARRAWREVDRGKVRGQRTGRPSEEEKVASASDGGLHLWGTLPLFLHLLSGADQPGIILGPWPPSSVWMMLERGCRAHSRGSTPCPGVATVNHLHLASSGDCEKRVCVCLCECVHVPHASGRG